MRSQVSRMGMLMGMAGRRAVGVDVSISKPGAKPGTKQGSEQGTEPAVVTKILASQRAITIGSVLGEMRRIFKTQPRIVLGASPGSAGQARDLSLRSRVWPELDHGALTPFPVGVAITAADLLRRLQVGGVGELEGSLIPGGLR